MCGVKTSPLSSGVKVAGDVHQLKFSSEGYGTKHHYTSSAEIVDLKDAVPSEPFIPASVDTCTAISFLQLES
jgi:hypothetical protein